MNLNLRSLCFLLSLLFLFPIASQAQFEFGMGYLHSTPRGPMSTYMNGVGQGYSIDFAYRIPRTNLSFGFQFGNSTYGFEKREDTYRFANGYEGQVDVEIYNYFSNSSIYARYDLFKEGFVQPYLLLGGGLSQMYTELSILDPREAFTSDCPKPIETSTLLKDRTSYLLLGGGLRLDLSYPIQSLERRKLLLDIRINYLDGGEVRYMSLNKPNILPGNQPGENVFINFASAAQPEIIHEYHAGSSFQSRMQLITINASLFILFDIKKSDIRQFLGIN